MSNFYCFSLASTVNCFLHEPQFFCYQKKKKKGEEGELLNKDNGAQRGGLGQLVGRVPWEGNL